LRDTLDAMISDRPYAKPCRFPPRERKFAGISGRQFDPRVVEVFLSQADSVWLELQR